MIDFGKTIFENRAARTTPFLAAHRGVCGANVPCNTMAAYKIALNQGADVVEIDVSKSSDGVHFVFHPDMEPAFLGIERRLPDMTAEEIRALRLINQDNVPTSYTIPTLCEVLAFLKGKAYINVDKFWTDIEGISAAIRQAGVEKQVIVKTYTDAESLEKVRKYASDFMFMPMVKSEDTVTAELIEKGVNVIGAEILFKTEDDPVIRPDYINAMHEKGLLIWMNGIVYNEKSVISADHTDDISVAGSPDEGWGWIVDKGADFIQTDWLLMLKRYLDGRK